VRIASSFLVTIQSQLAPKKNQLTQNRLTRTFELCRGNNQQRAIMILIFILPAGVRLLSTVQILANLCRELNDGRNVRDNVNTRNMLDIKTTHSLEQYSRQLHALVIHCYVVVSRMQHPSISTNGTIAEQSLARYCFLPGIVQVRIGENARA
jgi:hypothetical protein